MVAPRCSVRLMVEMLEPYKGRVYDPSCGSGDMFVQSEFHRVAIDELLGQYNGLGVKRGHDRSKRSYWMSRCGSTTGATQWASA
jgi:hypothetical protein